MEKQVIRLTEQDLHNIVMESVNKLMLTEAFKSDMLRDFFMQHGGVNKEYRQFSLGDINDDQIGYSKKFGSANEASTFLFNLKKGNPYTRQRSEADMKYLFHIFVANDGTALLIGVDRNTIETRSTWGGEVEKKVGDRLWRNGWNFKTRDNRYVDDSDTYYYHSPANDFGVHDSEDFQSLKQHKQKYPVGDKKASLKRMHDYLKKYYPNTFDKLKNKDVEQ